MKTLTPGEYEEKKSNLTSTYLLFEGGWEEE